MNRFVDQNERSIGTLHKRPILVWVICSLYVFGLLASLYYFLIKLPLILSGAIPVYEGLREYMPRTLSVFTFSALLSFWATLLVSFTSF